MKKIAGVVFLLALAVVLTACTKKVTQEQSANTSTQTTNTSSTTNTAVHTNTSAVSDVTWEFSGTAWQANGTPPACPNPLALSSPVNLTAATAVLYPGQTRGSDYKAHGGFRFDRAQTNAVTVTAPLDAAVYSASRYIERGEVQYLFTFINPCGIMYRFDHLLTLSPALQAVADQLPPAQVDDSRTTRVSGLQLEAGDQVATAVGFTAGPNVSVDFGVYDLRTKNAKAGDTAWASSHSAELAQYAVCWLDYLTGNDKTAVRTLPAGDSTAGKTSDFCST